MADTDSVAADLARLTELRTNAGESPAYYLGYALGLIDATATIALDRAKGGDEYYQRNVYRDAVLKIAKVCHTITGRIADGAR